MQEPETNNGMRRPCFVCGSLEGPTHIDRTVDVLGVGKQRMAYRACGSCGLVLQDPAVPVEMMLRYYRNFSNYTNAGRGGEPTDRKKLIVEDQIKFVASHSLKPGSAFQVGCSDGYTLSRFAAAGWRVAGCDPSPATIALAEEKWNVKATVGDFESYEASVGEVYDLFILTHVLEHIYDPVAALQKAEGMLADNGALLVEVPLLTEVEHLIEGYFTFEHINYFSHNSLVNTLEKAGFELVGSIHDDYEADQYPIQRLVAKKKKDPKANLVREEVWAANILANFEDWELNQWQSRTAAAVAKVGKGKPAIIWAAGLHTSQLFFYTNIRNDLDIVAIVDNDSQKWGSQLHDIDVISPEDFWQNHADTPLVISSRASEKEIAASLASKGKARDEIILLYQDIIH
ncbi:MAG: class I SAM-dependent methyltransferase [Alphaproteobacteria bacterium]|nr:class I SAM-dependent methyltransferase [Alphaproteobacteria bacterium]